MISRRAQAIDASGIRKIFDLAAQMKDPINLSMGQPDFDAFPEVKRAAIDAIESGKSKYLTTQGLPELRARIRTKHGIAQDDTQYDAFVTSGVTGGFALSYLTLLDPGDEILIPDPFFVVYRDLAIMLNAVPTYYNTYPSFKLDVAEIEKSITPRTKAIVVNSPGNPTGYTCSQAELDAVVALAREKDLYLIYDEIYDCFCFDAPHVTCLKSYDKVILLNGFSKSAGVAGWRLGYAVGPSAVIQQMYKLQQFSYVCANSIGQWAMLPVFDVDFTPHLDEYRRKRDFMCEELKGKYQFVRPGGAFYLFPEAPGGNGTAFVQRCIKENLLVVPGGAFSRQDTHFRISFSAPWDVLEKGVAALNRVA